MLPHEQEWWLFVVLAILLGIVILVFGPLSLVFAIATAQPLVAAGLCGFWSVLLVALWFLKLRIRSVDRAKRMLKKYPDLLGIANGELSDKGMVFRDGVRTYWFGPQHMCRAAILPNGVRISVDGSVYRYLALIARLFDGYSMELASRLKRRWSALAEVQLVDDPSDGADLWDRVGEPPIDAIRFKGQVTVEHNMRTAAVRNKAVSELLAYLTLPVMVVLFRAHLETWHIGAASLYVVYGLITNARLWAAYYRLSVQQAWYQFGWISEHEFAVYSNAAAVRMPLGEIVSKNDSQDLVVLSLKSGQPYHLPRQSFGSDEQWNRMRAIPIGAQSLASSE